MHRLKPVNCLVTFHGHLGRLFGEQKMKPATRTHIQMAMLQLKLALQQKSTTMLEAASATLKEALRVEGE